MDKVKIGDVCKLKSGTSLKDNQIGDEGKYPYVKVSDMNLPNNEKYITWSRQYTNSDISEKMVFPQNTIIFPKRGGAIGTNKKRIVNIEICADLNVMGVTPNDSIEPLYLYYYFQKLDFNTLSNGSSVPQINNTDIAPLEINLYSKEKQAEIISQLDNTDEIIALRKEQLIQLDNLIKSRFVELFGEQQTNPKKWRVGTIRDVVTDVKYGTSKPAVDSGKYKYLRMNNITYGGELDLTSLKYIDMTENEYEKCVARRGDVLFNRTNSKELVGKTCVFDKDEEMIIAGYIIRVRMNEKALPVYLSTVLNSQYGKKTLFGMCKAIVGQANINAKELQNISILIPPIELQQEFDEFKQQVDKLKVEVQKSLDETQVLFNSLMQEYFG